MVKINKPNYFNMFNYTDNFNIFVAKITIQDEKKPIKRKIAISVLPSGFENEATVAPLVKKILNDLSDELSQSHGVDWFPKITINSYDSLKKEVIYEFENESHTLHFDEKEEFPSNVTIKKLNKIKFAPFTDEKEKESEKEDESATLLSSLASSLSSLGSLFLGRGSASSTSKLTPYTSHLIDQSPQGFLSRLKLFSQQLNAQPSNNLTMEKLQAEVAEAVKFGSVIQEMHEDKSERMTGLIFVIKYIMQNGGAATIPAGYYKGDQYYPMLLRFVEIDGGYEMQTIFLENEENARISPFHIYHFNKEVDFNKLLTLILELQKSPSKDIGTANSSQMGQVVQLLGYMGKAMQSNDYALIKAKLEALDEIEKFLEDHNVNELMESEGMRGFIETSNKPTSVSKEKIGFPDSSVNEYSLDPSKKIIIHDIKTMRPAYADEFSKMQAQRGEAPSTLQGDTTTVAEMIDRIIRLEGGEPQPLSPRLKHLYKPSQDWSKLFSRWIELADSDYKNYLISLQTSFVINYIDRIMKEIDVNSELKPHQKLELLLDVEKAMNKLEKRYLKEYGHQAFQLLWRGPEGKGSILDPMRRKIREIKENAVIQQYQRLTEKTVNKSWHTSVPIEKKEKHAKSKDLKTDFRLQHYEKYSVFQTLMNESRNYSLDAKTVGRERAIQAKQAFTLLLQDCTNLLEEERYQELELVSTAILTLLEPPKSTENQVSGTFLWDHVPPKDIEEWSQGIELATRCLWNCQLKLHRKTLWPSQASGLMVSRAILVKLLQRQAAEVRMEARDKFSQLSSDEIIHWETLFVGKGLGNFSDVIAEGSQEWLTYLRRDNEFIIQFLKELGLSPEKILLAIHSEYPTDVEQIRYVINEHPYFHFGRDTTEDTKMLSVLKFFKHEIEHPSLPLLLDDDLRAPGTDNTNDAEFMILCYNVLNAFSDKDQQSPSRDQIWSQSWGRNGKAHFPNLAVDMRKHVLFTQMMLHPESTCFRNFSSRFEAIKWSIAIATQALEETQNYTSIMKGANEKVQKEVEYTIAQMGPLDIAQETIGITLGTNVQISDKEGAACVVYYPTGPQFEDFRKPFHDEAIIGQQDKIHRSFIVGSVAASDFPSTVSDTAEKRREISTKEQLTEATVLEQEHLYPSTTLDPVINAQLRTLVVRDSHGAAVPMTIYNVVDFIFQHPHLLENEAIQRVLEHAFTATGALQSVFETNPQYIVQNQLGKNLKNGIEYALTNDRILAATFLMHMSELLKEHVKQAIINLNLDDPNRKLLEESILLLPGHMTTYRYKNKSHTGMEFLRKYVHLDDVDAKTKKFIYTYLMNFIHKDPDFTLNALFEITHEGSINQNSIDLLLGYAYLKNVGDDSGSPILQEELINWIGKIVLPCFENIDAKDKKKNLTLQTLLNDGRQPVAVNEWAKISEFIYQNKKTKSLVNLEAGIYQQQGFQTTLPEEILKKINFFKKDKFPVFVKAREGSNLRYSFVKNDRKFRINFNSRSKEVEVWQQFNLNKPAWYKFQEVNQGSEPLIKHFGIWINKNKPLEGILILDEPDAWKPEDIFTVKISHRSPHLIHTPLSLKNELLYNDQDDEVSGVFPFVQKQDLILTQMYKNYPITCIRIKNKNIILRIQESGAWKCEGDAEGFNLLQDPIKLKYLFDRLGPHFQLNTLPLHQIDPMTEMEQIRCVIFPVRIIPPTLEDSRLGIFKVDPAPASTLPTLKATIESGKTDAADGTIQTTSTGFMYLAYHAYATGDYQKAYHWLEKTMEMPFIQSETSVFEQILSYVQEHPDDSVRGVAFKLKILLAARQIRRDQLGEKEYRPKDWKNYTENIRYEISLFQNYQNKIKNKRSGDEKKRLLGESLLLTKEEKRQYRQMIQESLKFLVEHGHVQKEEEGFRIESVQPFKFFEISATNLAEFCSELSKEMKNPHENSIQLENQSLYPNYKEFLQDFWGYCLEISQKNITSDDWRILKLKMMILTHLEPDQARVIEIGRQLLIGMSTACNEEGVKFIAKKAGKIPSLRSHFEISPIPNELKSLMAEIKANPIVSEQVFWQSDNWVKPMQTARMSIAVLLRIEVKRLAAKLLGRFAVTFKMPAEVSDELIKSLMPLYEFHNKHLKLEAFIKSQAGEEKSETGESSSKYVEKGEGKEKDPYFTTKEKIKTAIEDPATPFSSSERLFWNRFLDEAGPRLTAEKEHSILDLLETFVLQGIHMPSARHEAEGLQEIKAITNKPKPALAGNEKIQLFDEYYQLYLFTADQVFNDLIEQFAPASWKPSEEDIKNGLTELSETFASEYDKILQSRDQKELSELVQQCQDHKLSTPGKFFGSYSLPLSHEWYLAAAAQIHLNEIRMEMEETSLIPLKKQGRNFIPDVKDLSIPTFLKDLDEKLLKSQANYKKNILNQQRENIIHYYPDDASLTPMERKENKRIREACENVFHDKVSELDSYKGVVAESHLEELESKLKNYHLTCKARIKQDKKQISLALQKNARYLPELKQMLIQSETSGDAEILEKTLDLFKANRLITSTRISEEKRKELTSMEGNIALFLYNATEAQQIFKAIKSLEGLKQLSMERKANTVEWDEKSTELLGYLESAKKRDRYVDNEYCLSSHARKHLVAEYRSEVIARDYQPAIVEQLVDNPNILILLRPGAGKSKWIMPEVAQLLAQEKGVLPVILVTDELVHINSQDMDKATREMFRQARHVFNFDRKTPKDVSYLMDEFKRLYEVSKTDGYIITTIARMAALDDEIFLTKEEMASALYQLTGFLQKTSQEIEDLQSNPDYIKLLNQLVELHKQHHWLLKIRSLFHAEDVQYIADEVDDIFNINRDYNYSLGVKGDPPNPDLCRAMQQIMHTIMNSENEVLVDLRSKLLHSKQALLSGTTLEGGNEIPKTKLYMREIANAIFYETRAFGLSEEEYEKIKCTFQEDFVNFVTGETKNLPEEYQISGSIAETNYKYISAIKHFLTLTLPNAMTQEAEVNFGLSPDGCSVVPKDKAQEIPNVRYGDEYELIAFQYMYYASKIPSFEYFKQQFRKQEDLIAIGDPNALEIWQDWYNNAQVEDKSPTERLSILYEKLKEPESWKQRLAFLNSDILPKRIKVFKSQVKCNAQDPLYDANISGASGTVNEYSLPDSFKRDPTVYSRNVGADTFFRISEANPQGFDKLVGVYENAEELLISKARDPDCKFMIDQAASMESNTSIDIVQKFRTAGIQRQFSLVHPVTRKQMVWNPSDAEPQPYDRLKKLDPDCLVVFAAPDVRGTDWPIPPGKGILITGPTTTDDIYIQAVWRPRRLGQGHSVEPYIHRELARAYNKGLNRDENAEITTGELMNEIKRSTLDQKSVINYKATSYKIGQILPQKIKNGLFTPYIDTEETYWDIGNQLSLYRFFSDIAADCAFFEASKDLYIQTREIDFDADFAPQSPVQTLHQIESLYDIQQNKTEIKIEKFIEAEEEAAQLLASLLKNTYTPIHSETQRRMNHLQTGIKEIPESIEQAKREFAGQTKIHRAHLKPTVSASSSTSGSQEQVQEQEQQQQQQQQMVSAHMLKTTRPTDLDSSYHQWENWPKRAQEANVSDETPILTFLQSDFSSGADTFNGLSVLAGNDCGFDPEIIMSPNYLNLWKKLPKHDGDLLGRIVVLEGEEQSSTEKGKEKKGRETLPMRFILVDQLDIDRGIAADIAMERKISSEERRRQAAVYSLYPSLPGMPLLNCIMSTTTEQHQEAHIEKLVQVKIVAGSITFVTDIEKECLISWITKLNKDQKMNLIDFISKIHGVETPGQIPGWNESILRQLLVQE